MHNAAEEPCWLKVYTVDFSKQTSILQSLDTGFSGLEKLHTQEQMLYTIRKSMPSRTPHVSTSRSPAHVKATSAKNDATANRGYRHSTASNILSIQNINRKSNRGISTAYKGDFTPTVEQQAILDCFAEGKHNIFINACVGSGKTTLCLELALRNPNLHTCLVVFNRRLADETRQKVSDRGIKNIKIYTIHELATRYYSSACHTDEGLRRVVWHNMPPCESPEMFDVLIVDEAQDLSPVTYNFIRHHYKHAANQ